MSLKSFFYLQRSDRKVILSLVILIMLCLITSFFIGEQVTETSAVDGDSLAWKGYSARSQQGIPYEVVTESGKRLFAFDPNTATAEELLQLGLSEFQVRNILKYRSKGGVYRAPMDFARLYGLTRKQYRELEPYIRIGDDYQPASTLASVQSYIAQKEADKQAAHEAYEQYKATNTYKPYVHSTRDTVLYPLKIKLGEHINLVSADTNQLKKVPGIGSGWAKAIVNYGKRLGGYVATGQLLEIEGFPEEALPYFSVVNPKPEKLNLNTLSLGKLRSHPYINFYQARAICDYRRLKGKLTSLSQLQLLKDFNAEAIDHLRPYVEF